MPQSTKTTLFPKLLIGAALVVFACMYGCNNSASTEEKKDTAAATAAPKDTAMTMKADTAKTDTSGRGGQAPPPAH